LSLTEQTRASAKELIARYPRPRSALLPLLYLVQSEEGYVSPAGIAFCADELGLTKAEVGAVATFYTMFKRRPVGDYLVSVCTNTLCGVLGGDAVLRALGEHLGVDHDGTTPDGRITLEHAECLAACDYAPVMTVNYEFFDQVDPPLAVDLVRRLQAGERPHPTRGAALCSFQEMSRQLAGFDDLREGAVADGPAGAPTLAGNRFASERGIVVDGFDPSTPIPPVPPKDGGRPAAPAAEKPAPAATAAKPAAGKPTAEKPAPAPAQAPARAPVGTPAGALDNAQAAQSRVSSGAATPVGGEPQDKAAAEARASAEGQEGPADPKAAEAANEGGQDGSGEAAGKDRAQARAGNEAEAEGIREAGPADPVREGQAGSRTADDPEAARTPTPPGRDPDQPKGTR